MMSSSNNGGFKRDETIILNSPTPHYKRRLVSGIHIADSGRSLLVTEVEQEPKDQPNTLKGDGRRELLRSKSGFTYPSAKSRGR